MLMKLTPGKVIKTIFVPALLCYFWAVVLALYREMGREGNPYTGGHQISYGVTYNNKSEVNPNQDNC